MQVFGVPSAVGALAAVASAAALNPDVGMALGALTAGVGSVLAGYYVTAGFDKKLVKLLQSEAVDKEHALAEEALEAAILRAEPHLQQRLRRIVHHHAAIEAEFQGEFDEVEAILASSRDDLTALRDRAVSIVILHSRLRDIIASSDGPRLWADIKRMDEKLKHTPEGAVRDALESAKEASERTHGQWRQAIEKQQQIDAVLTIIETNLQEFKLAMELRKADAAMSSKAAGPEVSELQARLAAAGQACDELVGRKTSSRRRRRRVSKV